jgi:hypothetical protein
MVSNATTDIYMQEETTSEPSFLARPIVKIAVKVIVWTIAVTNTELLVHWNHFDHGSSSRSSWQLGQVSLSTGVGMYYQHLIISIGPAVVSGHPAPDEHGQCIQTITDINK